MHLQDILARIHLARGEPERALPLADAEVEQARAQFSHKLKARALELRGRALVHLDRRDDAAASLREALEIAKRIGYPPATWRSLSLLAELARRRGERSQAERLAQEASGLVTRLAGGLPETELRDEFGALAEGLVSDPLGAYR
jgi:tetratricopeptide (TPR) repeat protein